MNDTTHPPYPDLEIYLKKVDPADIIAWLVSRFENENLTLDGTNKQNLSTECVFSGGADKPNMHCIIMEKAAKGGFISLWFKSNNTPWETDRALALEAFSFFNQEVRCSTGPWIDDDAEENAGENEASDEGGWIRFSEDGEQIVNWFTG